MGHHQSFLHLILKVRGKAKFVFLHLCTHNPFCDPSLLSTNITAVQKNCSGIHFVFVTTIYNQNYAN